MYRWMSHRYSSTQGCRIWLSLCEQLLGIASPLLNICQRVASVTYISCYSGWCVASILFRISPTKSEKARGVGVPARESVYSRICPLPSALRDISLDKIRALVAHSGDDEHAYFYKWLHRANYDNYADSMRSTSSIYLTRDFRANNWN